MLESILDTIKQMLGLSTDDASYDSELLVFINSAFNDLTQIGAGPAGGFEATDKNTKWDAFLGEDTNFHSVKQFIYLKVKLVFDPPQTSYVIQAFEKQIEEATFRINVRAES